MIKPKNFVILICCILLIFISSCNKHSQENLSESKISENPSTSTPTTSDLENSPTASQSTQSSNPTDIIQTPTPTINPIEYYDKDITFSVSSGFYKTEFDLSLSYNTEADIRFTLDGSTPSIQSQLYTKPFRIKDLCGDTGANDNATVVRAAAFIKNKQVSNISTMTYFVNNKYSSFKHRYEDLAVVSISTNKENLYGDTGIFTNFEDHGRDSERKAHIEFFDKGGTLGFSADAGIRVYGGTSRGNPQKSLKIVARKEYDSLNGKFKYAIFPNRTNTSGEIIDRYDSFILRAGGNDNLFSSHRQTYLRDALIHTLSLPISNISAQAYRPCVVYINGDYFGIYNIRDDLDNDYIEQHYNIPKNEIAIIAYGHENGNWFYKIDEGSDDDLNNYKNMLSYIISHDMSYENNYSEAQKILDMDNFIKYIGINVYANNRDWPHNNVRAWCHNGKWRFMLKDIDYSWGIYHIPGAAENVVAEETAHTRNVLIGFGGSEISQAFASLMKNPTFKKDFLEFMQSMIDSYFSTQTAKSVIKDMVYKMSTEYNTYSTTYWYTNPDDTFGVKYKINLSKEEWLNAVNTLYEYAEKRPEIMKNLLNELYGFSLM